jgi:hypothetical protein
VLGSPALSGLNYEPSRCNSSSSWTGSKLTICAALAPIAAIRSTTACPSTASLAISRNVSAPMPSSSRQAAFDGAGLAVVGAEGAGVAGACLVDHAGQPWVASELGVHRSWLSTWDSACGGSSCRRGDRRADAAARGEAR